MARLRSVYEDAAGRAKEILDEAIAAKEPPSYTELIDRLRGHGFQGGNNKSLRMWLRGKRAKRNGAKNPRRPRASLPAKDNGKPRVASPELLAALSKEGNRTEVRYAPPPAGGIRVDATGNLYTDSPELAVQLARLLTGGAA